MYHFYFQAREGRLVIKELIKVISLILLSLGIFLGNDFDTITNAKLLCSYFCSLFQRFVNVQFLVYFYFLEQENREK